MKKVICIMGKSGTGKSTLINELIKNNEGFHNVKSFTTRKVREHDYENDLKTHTFVNVEKFEEDKNNNKIIALYHNKELNYYSWTTDESFSKEKINLYTIDPKAFIELIKQKNKDVNYFGIYLSISEKERMKRILKRNGITVDMLVDFEHHLSSNILLEDKEMIQNKDYDIINLETTNTQNIIKIINDIFKKEN